LDVATFRDNKRLYVGNALTSIQHNDWEGARRTYTLALNNSQWAEDPPKEQATLNLQVGRANGVTCHYDVAQQYLDAAYELDHKSGGPGYWALLESGRLNLAQEKYAEALGFLQRAGDELDQTPAGPKDPAGLADALDAAAEGLVKGGNADAVSKIKARADNLRQSAAGKAAATAPAPYGTQCGAAKN
jgi:tetratricopeptide (TPR) repeat protein